MGCCDALVVMTKERDELRAAYADEVTYNNALRTQVAELEKQRDELVGLLERASMSLGAFVSDLGWAQADMDTMDSIDAALAKLGADKTGEVG